jgi:hypothetical protein
MKRITILITILSLAFTSISKAQDDIPRGKEKLELPKLA